MDENSAVEASRQRPEAATSLWRQVGWFKRLLLLIGFVVLAVMSLAMAFVSSIFVAAALTGIGEFNLGIALVGLVYLAFMMLIAASALLVAWSVPGAEPG
jgi:hypothetical protein